MAEEDTLNPCTGKETMPRNHDGGYNILIVRPGALGDTILSVPLVETIRSKHPAANIIFLGTHAYRDLLPPDVEFGRFDSTRWLWLVNSLAAALPSMFSPLDVAYVILKNPDHVIRNLRRAGTDRIFHASPEPMPGRHMVATLHDALGFSIPEPAPCLKHLGALQEKDLNGTRRGTSSRPCDEGIGADKLIWVHPGSGGPSKCVPLGKMVGLVDALRRSTGSTVAVTAGEEDSFLKDQPEWSALIDAPGTRVLVRRPLLDVCRELAHARLFVGNDSGMAHLAAGLGIPAAVFFVTTDPQVWTPWAPPGRLRVVDFRELPPERIDIEREVSGILELIT